MNKSTIQASAMILTGVALIAYAFTKYFEDKYEPDTNLETQRVYKQLSADDQLRLKQIIPVLNAGLVREKRFWEKKAYYEIHRTSQEEFEHLVQKAVSFDKHCEKTGKHLNGVEKAYWPWNDTTMSCG